MGGEEDVPLFQRKPKVMAADFCRQWYDEFVFASELEGSGIDPWSTFIDEVIGQIAEAGVDVLTIDWDLFGSETYALRMEMFGTAYAHRTREDAALAVAETAATKNYLSERGRGDLWDRMLAYNVAVARTSAMRRSKVTSMTLDGMRLALAKKYLRLGSEPDCAVRAANRVGTSVEFAKLGTPRLGYALAQQTNLESSAGVLLILGALALGFYNGARESLEEVDLQA